MSKPTHVVFIFLLWPHKPRGPYWMREVDGRTYLARMQHGQLTWKRFRQVLGLPVLVHHCRADEWEEHLAKQTEL